MDNKKLKEINTVLDTFNRQISRLLKAAEPKCHNSEVERVRKMIGLVRQISPSLMLEKSIDKLWENRESIVKRDAEFFLDNPTVKFKKFIKNDERKEFIHHMLKIIDTQIKLLTEDELDYMWNCVNEMLECVIKYKLLTEDYSQ